MLATPEADSVYTVATLRTRGPPPNVRMIVQECDTSNAAAWKACVASETGKWDATTGTCAEKGGADDCVSHCPPWKACKKARGVFNKETKVGVASCAQAHGPLVPLFIAADICQS